MHVNIGYAAAELNCLEVYIRHEETNVADWIADLAAYMNRSNIAIFNCGMLRMNDVIEEGPITMKMVLKMLPIHDPVVILKLKGSSILKLLENGISGVPYNEGRFPAVSGL
jgi:2',3'-cyclic-nucleotide 2'-phosphodiesterase (5'-nucleotidase family)